MAKKKWIKKVVSNKGALHRNLGVPEGEKIPAKKMEAAAHSFNPKIRKEAALAHTLKGFHHRSSLSTATKMYGKKAMEKK